MTAQPNIITRDNFTNKQVEVPDSLDDNRGQVTVYARATGGCAADGLTNDQDALQEVFNAASSRVGTGDRVKVVIEPGTYLVSNVSLGANIDLEMMPGADIVGDASTCDFTRPILTIGSAAARTERARYTGLSVWLKYFYSSNYRFRPDYPLFSCIRIVNVIDSKIEHVYTWGAYNGMILDPGDAGIFGYNQVTLGFFDSHKFGLTILGNENTGWANDNNFYGGNFSPTSMSALYGGSVACLRFTRTSKTAYNGQQNNTFIKPCFQPDAIATTAEWASGKTGLGKYHRVYSGGYVYCVMSTGENQTAGTNAPHLIANGTTIGSTVTDNAGVQWYVEHPAISIPVAHGELSGSGNRVLQARWEYGTRAFVVVLPYDTTATESQPYGNEYDFYDGGGHVDRAGELNSYVDDSSVAVSATTQIKYKSIGIVRASGQPKEVLATVFSDLHKIVIKGSRWCFPGMMQCTLYDRPPVKTLSALIGDGWKLCATALFGAYPELFGVRVDTSNFKRFTVATSPQQFSYASQSVYYAPRNSSGTVITALNSNAIAVSDEPDAGTYRGYDAARSNKSSIASFCAGGSTAFVDVMFSSGYLRNANISAQVDGRIDSASVIDLINPVGSRNESRFTYGEPTIGFFETLGEKVADISTGTIYTTTTAGALAPAWASAVAVVGGELRSNASKIYYAASAHTTSGSAPTHTSGTVNNWTYLSAQAVLA